MKLARVLPRVVILLVVAAAFVGLTAVYGNSTNPVLPDAVWQAEHQHEPSAPNIGYFSEFVGWGIWLAVCCVVGRMLFRLRLNPVPRGEGQPILLDLRPSRRDSLNSSPSRAGPTPPIG